MANRETKYQTQLDFQNNNWNQLLVGSHEISYKKVLKELGLNENQNNIRAVTDHLDSFMTSNYSITYNPMRSSLVVRCSSQHDINLLRLMYG